MGVRSLVCLALVVSLPISSLSSVAQVNGVLRDGTRVPVRLLKTISSETSHEGDPVELEVMEDVTVDGQIVLEQGTPVRGVVVEAVPKRRMGRAGRLVFRITETRWPDGERVRLRSTEEKEGDGHVTAVTVTTVISAVLFWPAAPFMLLRRGKEVGAAEGAAFDAFVDGDHQADSMAVATSAPVEVPRPTPQTESAAATAPAVRKAADAATTVAAPPVTPTIPGTADVEGVQQVPVDAETSNRLSNDDIIKMAKGDLSDDLIIALIARSPTAFDLSPDALVSVRQAGVSNAVIAAMLEAQP